MTPGRGCPLSYRYDAARSFRKTDLCADTVWVAGGLYGNPFALERLIELYEAERGSKALVFNGDFHWFDVADFRAINAAVLRFTALRGNVETELASPGPDAGCGCAYPDWVDDGTVDRSNRILERLRAAAAPEDLLLLKTLPMTRVAEVGGVRVGMVHGDAGSLAGWDFSQERLATAAGLQAAERAFDAAGVQVFASSHTCLPVLGEVGRGNVIVNNGAAGMPNFQGTRYGVATRISVSAAKTFLYGTKVGRVYVQAVAIPYDVAAWERRFLEQWPIGSDAHQSYYARIVSGPRYSLENALRAPVAVAA